MYYYYYEYMKYNHVAVGIGKRWGVICFSLAVTDGVYFEARLGVFFITWTHHGKALREEFSADDSAEKESHDDK